MTSLIDKNTRPAFSKIFMINASASVHRPNPISMTSKRFNSGFSLVSFTSLKWWCL